MNDLEFLDLGEIIQLSKIPYLFVLGQNDPTVILPYGDGIGTLPKTAHFIEFDSCGNFPMLDETEKI